MKVKSVEYLLMTAMILAGGGLITAALWSWFGPAAPALLWGVALMFVGIAGFAS